MEDYFERVVETLTGGRLPLVRDGELLPRRDGGATSARSTTSATGSATTTSGSGSARSRQSRALRWRNTPSLPRYLAALAARRSAAARARGARRGTCTRASA